LFEPIRDRHGLRRVRCAFTGGAALGPDVFRLVTAMGIDLRQTFGCSEMQVGMHSAGNVKVDSVGIVNPEKIVRIASNGEILVSGAAQTLGYYKNEAATQKAFAGGWFHSGDAGYFDEDGHLYYLDRIEYMRELADGSRYAPQYIESRLKFSPFIKDAFVVGDNTKPFIGVVVEIDFENVGNWAEKKRIPYTTFADLSQRSEVCELIRQEVQELNEKLPERISVKRFVNAPKAFDPDESELTRTMKLRRGFMEQRYKTLVEAIYGEAEEVPTEVKVVYRDGRTATVSTRLRVIRT
jgi:long-chain acyl-CoA synthetase